jgi:hypothetical protein
MLFGSSFQSSSAICWLCNFPGRLPSPPNGSHDSPEATPAGLTLQRFRLLRFRSPLLTQSNFFLFLRVLRWFTSPGLLFRTYFIQLGVTGYKPAGFPHSEISGSQVVCTSPKLIAAYHVLHRLHAPRHPPCALSSLTIKFAHHKLGQHSRIMLYSYLHFLLTSSTSEIAIKNTTPEGTYWEFAYSIIKEQYLKTYALAHLKA